MLPHSLLQWRATLPCQRGVRLALLCRFHGSGSTSSASGVDGEHEEADEDCMACEDGRVGPVRVPWLSLPSPVLSEAAFVHRGPLAQRRGL